MPTSRIILKCLLLVIAAALITAPYHSPAMAGDDEMGQPSPGSTFIDALFYRPVGLVAIPLGGALFIVSLPFSLTGGNVSQSFSNLVIAPAKFTFARPLGDL